MKWPNIDPCGTPYFTIFNVDLKQPNCLEMGRNFISTYCCLPVRYVLSQFKTLLFTPNSFIVLSSGMHHTIERFT